MTTFNNLLKNIKKPTKLSQLIQWQNQKNVNSHLLICYFQTPIALQLGVCSLKASVIWHMSHLTYCFSQPLAPISSKGLLLGVFLLFMSDNVWQIL
jgi:hypothetical protein